MSDWSYHELTNLKFPELAFKESTLMKSSWRDDLCKPIKESLHSYYGVITLRQLFKRRTLVYSELLSIHENMQRSSMRSVSQSILHRGQLCASLLFRHDLENKAGCRLLVNSFCAIFPCPISSEGCWKGKVFMVREVIIHLASKTKDCSSLVKPHCVGLPSKLRSRVQFKSAL